MFGIIHIETKIRPLQKYAAASLKGIIKVVNKP